MKGKLVGWSEKSLPAQTSSFCFRRGEGDSANLTPLLIEMEIEELKPFKYQELKLSFSQHFLDFDRIRQHSAA